MIIMFEIMELSQKRGILIMLKFIMTMLKIIVRNGKELMKEEVKLKINKENKVIHLINLLQL